jgi:hypothetical protein
MSGRCSISRRNCYGYPSPRLLQLKFQLVNKVSKPFPGQGIAWLQRQAPRLRKASL